MKQKQKLHMIGNAHLDPVGCGSGRKVSGDKGDFPFGARPDERV